MENITPRRIIFNLLKQYFYILYILKFDSIMGLSATLIILGYNNNLKIKKDSILALERNVSNYDTEILKNRQSNFSFLSFPTLLRALFWDENYLFAGDKKRFRQENFYKFKDENIYNRFENINYYILVFVEKFHSTRIRVVLSGHMNYYQEYSWINAVHKNNGLFIVLCKESIFLDKGEEIWNQDYPFAYDGDYVFFYCKKGKDVYVNRGVVTEQQCRVTGCPRVDELVNLKLDTSNNDSILLLYFGSERYYAQDTWRDVLKELYNTNKEHVVIKCKLGVDAKKVLDVYPEFSCTSENIVSVLKTRPRVVVGLNTTAILDAYIVGLPVVIPAWNDAKVFDVFKENVNAETISQFKELLLTDFNNDIVGLDKIIEMYYSKTDGRCCERFFDGVEKCLLRESIMTIDQKDA